MKAFVSIIALVNLAVTVLHLFLAGKLNPALTAASSVRIGAYAGALTLAGVGLLWTRLKRIGAFVLIIGFAIGLAIGSLEDFLLPARTTCLTPGTAAGQSCSTPAWLFLWPWRLRASGVPGAFS